MKNITERFIKESTKKADYGTLSYVMTFKSFKQWLKSVDEKDEFTTVALVDTDLNLKDIESSQYAKTYYDNELKKWVCDDENNEEPYPVNEWTLSESDIILIWEK